MEQRGIKDIQLTGEMKKSFMEYAMSVIVARALPDAKDGLKPVQRRIIHGMNELGCYSDKPYKKSARIVGEVMGKYHPHGDSSIYEALVRMAQDFSYRYMLVDGHGNFGSIDGDGAAAMRYTESRMSKIGMEMVRDINKDTVDFVPNYDGEEKEPNVLPSRIPNLLINGSTGIAVGMATNIPSHNLGEVVDAILAVSKNPDITITELMDNYIPGPDFPTGAYILGRGAIKKAYETGNGLIVMRAKTDIEDIGSNKKAIIVTELPYMVNKARLIEKIAAHVKEKNIDGITELRDESDREGIRIVIELRRDVQPEVILNQLYKLTALQTTFGVNNIALVNGEPKTLSLKEMINVYLEHQEDVIRRRISFDLKKAEDRAHILDGLKRAINQIDAIINLIRSSRTTEIIQQRLMDEFDMSERQAKAIREMQLQRLAGLEREKIENELNTLLETIADLKDILANKERIIAIIDQELLEIKAKYGDKRRTEIIQGSFDIEDEDLIPEEDTVVAMTNLGYIKRMTVDNFKSQNRGGKGIKGMQTIDDDYIKDLFMTTSHHVLTFFTNTGRAYKLKAYEIPEASRTSRGTAIINLLQLAPGETITAVVPVKIDTLQDTDYLFMATKKGIVKKTPVKDFANIRKTGIQAINLREDDELIEVKLTDDQAEILMVTMLGQCIRFKETDVRPTGRSAMGVIGMSLMDEDEVVGVQVSTQGDTMLIVSENGMGKRTDIDEYTVQHRGGKGVKCYKITEKTGNVVGAKAVDDSREVMLITTEGIIIRLQCSDISNLGRITSGVKLINLDEGIKVATIAKVRKQPADEDGKDAEGFEEDTDKTVESED